ncbi:MAG: aminotransferase class V-fold PLP-dependent enzyme [Chlamydiia bacterium]|nr:aminotransferase class V-fold PLP-dependent enzyme [Chlamydiia bacterium]
MPHRVNTVYLDNQTTTRPSDLVLSQMLPFFTDHWGVPSAPHKKGQELIPFIHEYLQPIFNLFRAPEGVKFLLAHSGADAIEKVLLSSFFDVTFPTGKNQLLAPVGSDRIVRRMQRHLEDLGSLPKLIPIGSHGVVETKDFIEAVSPRTALVTFSWVNGKTGVVQPLKDIQKICQERGILLHLDVTHGLGKLLYDWGEIGADIVTFSGDHLHGPKGSGGILLRSDLKCSLHTEQGNFNCAALAGLAQALKEADEAMDYMCLEVARLRDKLEAGILESCPDVKVLFDKEERAPHLSAMTFPKADPEALLYALHRQGVFASADEAALTFGLSRFSTDSEVERAIAIVTQAYRQLSLVSGGLV